jgi:hypothetical protein
MTPVVSLRKIVPLRQSFIMNEIIQGETQKKAKKKNKQKATGNWSNIIYSIQRVFGAYNVLINYGND